MQRWLNPIPFRLICLMTFTWMLCGQLSAATTPSEDRAWKTAQTAFVSAKGPTMRAAADKLFVDFLNKYPTSDYYADAIVYRARILFDENNYDGVIDLLSTQATHAGTAADQFAYWTARAYSKKKNYEAAAEAFARLVRENTNSTLRLEALFGEADAHAKLEYWPRVVEELGETNGAFQQMALTNSNNELVVNGLLLLGEAQLAQHSFAAADKTLASVDTSHSSKELEWDRQALMERVELGTGRESNALAGISNLLQTATASLKPELKARTYMLEGEIYESLGQFPEAIRSYQTNLNSDVPAERRQALLNIVELQLRQEKLAEASQQIKDFLAAHPDEKGADLNRLLLGELELRQYYQTTNSVPAADGMTNLLQTAQTEFETIIKTFTNSQYLGKAQLNLGWCLLAQTNISGSIAAFSNAVAHLPFSADQAVAQFKWGDLLYQQKDFAGALERYSDVTTRYDSLPAVKNDLLEFALYKVVVTSIEVTNTAASEQAMNRILTLFPDSQWAERSMLLVGQEQNPGSARDTFARFIERSPQSQYLPEVKLAIARSYEREANWPAALAQYNAWVTTYSNSPALPRAEFSRAMSYYKSGDESNAFGLFTNFVVQFGANNLALSNDLPARAQFWVGDYYFRQTDFQKAEVGYRVVFDKWPQSEMALQARMRAGQAAVGRSPQSAIDYFTNLSSPTNYPSSLRAEALFAIGDAILKLPTVGDTNKYVNFTEAEKTFYFLATDPTYSNSTLVPLAWARLGDCYFALADGDASHYGEASNAFTKAMTFESATPKTRSLAEIRLGQTLAELSRLAPAAEQKGLRISALQHLMNVIHGYNLRTGEQADLFSIREAGLQAGQLAEDWGEWSQAIEFYQELKKIVPAIGGSLDKKITKAQEKMAQSRK